MSLQFEDQNNLLIRRNMYPEQNLGPIMSFLIRHKLVRGTESANALMILGAVVIFICATGLFILNVVKLSSKPEVKYNISKDVFNKLPQSAQIKLLE